MEIPWKRILALELYLNNLLHEIRQLALSGLEIVDNCSEEWDLRKTTMIDAWQVVLQPLLDFGTDSLAIPWRMDASSQD